MTDVTETTIARNGRMWNVKFRNDAAPAYFIRNDANHVYGPFYSTADDCHLIMIDEITQAEGRFKIPTDYAVTIPESDVIAILAGTLGEDPTWDSDDYESDPDYYEGHQDGMRAACIRFARLLGIQDGIAP